MNVKDMVKDNKKVKFLRYQNNELWYVTECGFEFPIPISDTGEAAFQAEDKALLFMRWINKHVKFISESKKEALTS